MAKRMLMLFTKYGEKNRVSLIRYLQNLENNVDLDFEFHNIPIDKDSIVAKSYGVEITPTVILLENNNEVLRLIGKKATKSSILKILKGE